jgi:hypothetical protein
MGAASNSGVRMSICNAKVDITKLLPPWVKGGDKIALDDYLTRFELVCHQHNFGDDSTIASLFMAKPDSELALILQDMAATETTSFVKIVEILKGYYRLTPEDYRNKFRGITRKNEESYAQFGTRLSNSFNKWMVARDAADNIDMMRFCLLMEPFMQATDDGLANYILDKDPTTIAEAATYADTYVSRCSMTRDMCKESRESNGEESGRSPDRTPPMGEIEAGGGTDPRKRLIQPKLTLKIQYPILLTRLIIMGMWVRVTMLDQTLRAIIVGSLNM